MSYRRWNDAVCLLRIIKMSGSLKVVPHDNFNRSIWSGSLLDKHTLRETCPYTECFCSTFSSIWIEYRDLLSKSPYSVQMRENADQKKLQIRTLFTQCQIFHKLARSKWTMQTIIYLGKFFFFFCTFRNLTCFLLVDAD